MQAKKIIKKLGQKEKLGLNLQKEVLLQLKKELQEKQALINKLMGDMMEYMKILYLKMNMVITNIYL
jgi:hypothetical protein